MSEDLGTTIRVNLKEPSARSLQAGKKYRLVIKRKPKALLIYLRDYEDRPLPSTNWRLVVGTAVHEGVTDAGGALSLPLPEGAEMGELTFGFDKGAGQLTHKVMPVRLEHRSVVRPRRGPSPRVQARQAEALRTAAATGVAFCEECAKAEEGPEGTEAEDPEEAAEAEAQEVAEAERRKTVQKAQAQGLRNAAQAGMAFCAECDKAG